MVQNSINQYEKDFRQISISETLIRIDVTKECGLCEGQANDIRKVYGENEIETPTEETLLDRALSLGLEPVRDKVLRRKRINRTKSIITKIIRL